MLFELLIAAIVCGVCQSASKIETSWSNCTSANDMGTVSALYFYPNPPPVGKNFTIVGVGTSKEAIADPSYDMHVKDGILVNTHVQGDACLPNQYDFPLNAGSLYYLPVVCPVKAGPMNVTIVAFVAAGAPDGKVVTTLNVFDQPKQKGNVVACTEVTLTITG